MNEEMNPLTEFTPTAKPAPPAPRPAANNNDLEGDAAGGPGEFAPAPGGRQRRTSVDARLDEINYKNVPLLSRFLDPRGRILSRRKTRVSAKMQRRVVQAIKHARHLALLPYTSDQTRIVRRRR